MNPPADPSASGWLLIPAIVVGFLVAFPLLWCAVMWILSGISGWRALAARYASGERQMGGARRDSVTGMIGAVSYRSVLTVRMDDYGFSLEVMPLFRIGHPRLFIPWSEISERRSRQVLWWKSVSLSVGHPAIATITLPTDLVENYFPA
jgi:hypothetical protein